MDGKAVMASVVSHCLRAVALGTLALAASSGWVACAAGGDTEPPSSTDVTRGALGATPSVVSVVLTAADSGGIDVGFGVVTLSRPDPSRNATVRLATVVQSLTIAHTEAVTGYVPERVSIPAGALTAIFPITPGQRGQARLVVTATGIVGAAGAASGALVIGRPITEGGNAVFDPVLRAPSCAAVSPGCGTTSIAGRGRSLDKTRGTPELAGQVPNNLGGGCPDGNAASPDRSLDGLAVATDDGSALGAGKPVTIRATVWNAGRLDLYSAGNASHPTWRLVASLDVGGVGPHALSAPFVLPAGTRQVVRGVFVEATEHRSTCPETATSDVDDLVFATDRAGGPFTNVPPTVDAGPAQTIVLPAAATLAGAVHDDGVPNPPGALTTTWSSIGGPAPVTFDDPSAVATAAHFTAVGNYVLRLTANDGAATATADVAVRVVTGNAAPAVDAGPDQTIVWPAPLSLAATVTDDLLPDPTGFLLSTWSVVDGPGTVVFAQDFSPTTTATFSTPGVYVLRLTATDSELSSSDDIVVRAEQPSFNQAPIVTANHDTTFFAVNFPSFIGATVVDDGLPSGTLTTSWSLVSGPGNVTIFNPDQLITRFVADTPGTYVFRVTVSDGELSSTDEVTLVADGALAGNAGANQTVVLPNSATLVGTASDDGIFFIQPIFAVWALLEGPGPVTFSDPLALATAASFTVPGRYVFQLIASDGVINSAPTQVVVNVLPPRSGRAHDDGLGDDD